MRWSRPILAAVVAVSALTGSLPARAAAADTASAAAAAVPGALPAPASLVARTGRFMVGEGTGIDVTGGAAAAWVAGYFARLVERSHALTLPVRARHDAGSSARGIVFRLEPSAAAAGPESYELDVSPERVELTASARAGLFYGAVTLWQLMSAPAADGKPAIAAVHVTDAPRFRWRGLMLDSARHFQSPEFVMRYIDWMALHKLNVLGWHLTDDQGWRLEIRKYPRLTSVGAWRVPAGAAAQRDIDPATGRPRLYGGFYTQAQVRRIVAYASERNVTVVPEIDMPGHATAAIVAYPRVGVLEHPPRAVSSDWGVHPNLFNVEESTFAFLEDVLTEVMELFPGEYIHTGGDEAVKDQWKASARVQIRMRELGVPNEAALQGYFTGRMAEFLEAHGRRLIGWDEILEGGVPQGAAVMSWRGVQGAIAAAARGHDTVLSPDPTLYLDNRQGTGAEEPPGRGRVVPLQTVYDFDPLPGPLANDGRHVLGVQANLWTEHVRTEEQASYMTWPRAAALAEVAWSPPARRSWPDFLARLPLEFGRYRTLGMRFSNTVFTPVRQPGLFERHMSQDLRTCTDKLVLNLEDDAPLNGARAVFLIDIENPCWEFPAIDLSRVTTLTAAVGQVPFNFQIGSDAAQIRLYPPRTAAGELEVHADGCDGELIALLPLQPATGNDAVTVLPPVPLPHLSGTHALCLRFTQRQLDPMWALDWIELAP
jgi:hexosaminidase